MIKISDPFIVTKTERTDNQKIVEWMNQIIREENLHFGFTEQETAGSDRKQPDIILFKEPQSTQISLVLELKPPYFDPLDYESIKKPAWEKANRRKAPYFATSNFQSLYLFNTEKANKFEAEERQMIGKYTLSNLADLNYIEDSSYKTTILKNLTIFLKDLDEYVHGKKPERLLAIDEWLILRLQEKVKILANYYQSLIENKCLNDLAFRRNLRKWFNDQGWAFVAQKQDFNKAARQTAYLLINKVLFYDVLRSSYSQNFPVMRIPEDFNKGGMVQRYLQNFFDEVLKIDYETIYSADFMDEIAFPDDKNVIYHIRELVKSLNRFNFAEIEYEVIGRIFESLIPAEERHVLGQYFTHPDIVDIILSFCLKEEKDKIFDPGCGAGTFLRRAYHLKKLINPLLSHEEIIPTLWGNDIAKFPSHLATINLAIADLKTKENYPRIVQKDFFEWLPGRIELSDNTRKVFLKSLGKESKETIVPKYFDAIVGNPPYTRQEEMDDLVGEKGKGYKENLIFKAVCDEGGRPYASLSKRAGLHAYFFVHATKFLKNNGRFGFIVSNSWLDVDYGKGLQEHFLRHYKIKAIIESKIERWFTEADVNTCIVLMEKCEGENKEKRQARENNLVRFVYLKKPLSVFIPKASRIFEETVERKAGVEKLLQYIFSKTEFFENEDLRVYCKNQKELWLEGFDEETQKYVGAKWGKYIRAPKIFFTILEKAKDKLIPLKQVADVHFGIKTGANDFFYLTEEDIKRRKIEKEFWMHKDKNNNWIPNYIIHSFKETKAISLNPKFFKYRILLVNLDKSYIKKTNILKYIKSGESKRFGDKIPSKTITCQSRGLGWYDLGKQNPVKIFYPRRIGDRFLMPYCHEGIFGSDNLFSLIIKKKNDENLLAAYLNSSIVALFNEVLGRRLTGSINVVDMDVWMVEKILVLDFSKVSKLQQTNLKKYFSSFSKRTIDNTLIELGYSDKSTFSLNNIKKDRREIDKLIMGEILRLSNEEQLEVYKAIIDLVKSRLDKAKSVKKKNKTKEGIDISLLVKTIVDKIGGNKLGKFYQKCILSQKNLKKITLPEFNGESRIDQTLMGYRLVSGKKSLDCSSEQEASYLQIFLETGWTEVLLPKDFEYLEKILPILQKISQEVKEAINYYTEGVLDSKLQHQVTQTVWQEVSRIKN